MTGTTLKVSRAFLTDFAYIASRYDWSEDDIEECKQATRENPDLKTYWSTLAYSHRNGYEQTKQNGYMRLETWLANRGELAMLIKP